MTKKITVLIVDDSPFIRRVYRDMLNSDDAIEVIGEAVDPIEARDFIKQHQPDVITLDIQMPRMDGLSFLQKLMARRPIPVVMSSTLTQKGADITLQALQMGAVEVIAKPTQNHDINAIRTELIDKVKAAAEANIEAMFNRRRPELQAKTKHPKNLIIALGASTGGVETLRHFLSLLPENMPPIVVTQHMPASFTTGFASNLDNVAKAKVRVAAQNEEVAPGHVYIAPGDRHLLVHHSAAGRITLRLREGELVSGHKPSVDVLFQSVADAGVPAIGVIFTGMGKDGAAGLLAMRNTGALTLGQDEASCVVYGMPKAAYQIGAVCEQLSPEAIAERLVALSFEETKGS